MIMWSDYGRTADNRGNNCTRCCGQEPTLRVHRKKVMNCFLSYVQYECKKCGAKGGLGILEEEARKLWEELTKG